MKKSSKNLMFLAFLFVAISAMAEGFMITETLRDSNSNNFVFGGDPVAFLTSGKKVSENSKLLIDPVGDGWLRLTKDTFYQRGYGYVKQPFPSSLGVQIDMEFKTWRTFFDQGADGFSVFLFDDTTSVFRIGGFGGSLGYAQYTNPGAEASEGLRGGYVGIGIDEFGNYSKGWDGINPDPEKIMESEGRIGGEGFHGNSLGVRGPAPDYRWITGNFKLNFKIAHEDKSITSRPPDSIYFRRIQVDIKPGTDEFSGKYIINARMKLAKSGKFIRVLQNYVLPEAPPDTLRLGFAASTGSCINYHELRNLYITTPNGLRVTKTVDKLYATVGDELTYTIDVYNQSDSLAENMKLEDMFDSFSQNKFAISSVAFDNNGYEENVASGYTDKSISDVTLTLEKESQSTFIIKGRIKGCPTNKVLKNTAIINVGSSKIIDLDQFNDTAVAKTIVKDLGLLAVNDRAWTGPDIPVVIPVLDNDLESDVPINLSSVQLTLQPKNGDVVTNADGTITYTPDKGFSGIDTMKYKMADTKGTVSNIANVYVTVDSRKIFIPNIFTPNGDGINETFEILGLNYYTNPELRICNRWGDEVYYNTNYDNQWDGNGLNEGTYYYTLILTYRGEKIAHKGWVMIKR